MDGTSLHITYESENADIYDGQKYFATFERNYFAHGASRWAFKGTLHGAGRRDGSLCVTKGLKKEFSNYMNVLPDVIASKRAAGFAKRFCDIIFPKPIDYILNYEIEVLIPLIAEVRYVASGLEPVEWDQCCVEQGDHVTIEPYLHGKYTKFNSNCGFEKSKHELMTAFCHWTWSISGHNFMVCDLQGVMTPAGRYILTDPCIHSTENLYGDTDISVAGMNMVLANHQCNQLCHQLELDNPVPPHSVPGRPRSTVYAFQITGEDLLRQNRQQRSAYFEPLPAIEELL